MKNKPVVLVIENSIDVTGALKSITRTAYDLKDYFEFQFIVPKHSKGRFWIESKGFSTIHELPMKELSRRFSSLALYVPFLLLNTVRLNKIVKRQNISIIHVNDLYNLLPVMLILFGNKMPYTCHIRFLPDRFPSWLFNFWMKLHLRYAGNVIAVSQSVLNMLQPHRKLVLIHNELPVEERYPELTEPDPQKHYFTFLYLSNFIKGKGQEYALEAFARIHMDLPNWKLRFVGGDMGLKKNQEYRVMLLEKARRLAVFEKTEWHGFTEEVEREYKEADIVLNFSESESFSITCLEALFFGRPVIAADCGGPAEIIEDGETGILVSNRNVEEMAMAMKRMAMNKLLRIRMGIRAREIVRNKFSVEKTSYRLMDCFKNVMKVEG